MLHHFADDTNIKFAHKCLKNTSKNKIILFWTKNKRLPRILTLEIKAKK